MPGENPLNYSCLFYRQITIYAIIKITSIHIPLLIPPLQNPRNIPKIPGTEFAMTGHRKITKKNGNAIFKNLFFNLILAYLYFFYFLIIKLHYPPAL